MLLYENLTEQCVEENGVVTYVFELMNRMKQCQELAMENMQKTKESQTLWYDLKAEKREFKEGGLVLIVASSKPNKLSVNWIGPGEVVKQLSETNYVIHFPDSDKTQIPLSKNALRYAAFVTNFGTFKPLRLPFGLKNAPYDFSRLMASILKDCEEYAVPYLDDVAIFSQTWEDHLKHLDDIFLRLSYAKLHIKPSKCQFAQAYVKYLGHLVYRPAFKNTWRIKGSGYQRFPNPHNKTQVRAFLGLAGYYRRYIPEFSAIAAPLVDLLKGRNRKSTVDWNSSCQNAFEELKTRLSKNAVLYSPDFTKPFIIQCDASNLGIGVVLSQRERDQVRIYHQRKSDERVIEVGNSDSSGSEYQASSFEEDRPRSDQSQSFRNRESGELRAMKKDKSYWGSGW
ncbi:retrovirus-related Pol polyprotein from transposon 297 [Trichonephila inaurata madagascariensis]|uniref:RNA-directed DNA polymerase n=1 Tax=Trichonephila inaurata madagascariensis TaxID=2747483 RepID=A0A8X6XXM2_9ARAC|nr:retrovirus-related Pol polyprotein from transposon 297 [Trichonephila inaurata madagascariensis]